MRYQLVATTMFLALLVSCSAPSGGGVALYNVPDPTTERAVLPTTVEVVERLGLHIDRWKGAVVEISPIGVAGYEPGCRIEIPPVRFPFLKNPFERDAEIRSFDSAVGSAIASVSKRSVPSNRSEVYLHVSRMINRLATEEMSEKECVVTSDLCEYNYALDFYGRDLHMLYERPAAVERYFDSIQPLKDLTNVTVRFEYVPKDNGNDSRRYEALTAIYRRLIERRHGKVVISGGNINRQP